LSPADAVVVDREEGKKRNRGAAAAEKKKRDPNVPKKPASTYLLFQNDVRDEIRKQNPDQPNTVILHKISEAWANLTDEQKKPYVDMVKSKAKFEISKEQ